MIFYIILVICVLLIILWISNKIAKKAKNFVLENSKALKKLKQLNSEYRFDKIQDFEISENYDNENNYLNVSCEDLLINSINNNISFYENEIKKAEEALRKYASYKEDLRYIKPNGEFYLMPAFYFSKRKLQKLEQKYFYKMILRPKVYFKVNVKINLVTNTNLCLSYKYDKFENRTILILLKRIKSKTGTFYNDRQIYDALCRVERAKVSNALRFRVYEKDNYQCVFCGTRGEHKNLEIDHIIPVSKGGKSEFNNLQTLCKKCNREKSNDIYYKKMN